MKRAFLDAYNRELALLYERSREFAADYPGIAERLGGLTQDNLDPAVAGLLEGAAFMAARVQLKLDEEFSTFTTELLDQILPDILAPTPSAMLAEAAPRFDDDDLAKGRHFPPGAYMDARYVDRDQRISCRFRLAAPLSLWPLRLTSARLHAGPGAFQALGLETLPETAGGLQLTLIRPSATDPDKPRAPLSEVQVDRLPVHLAGDMAESVGLYEHIFCNARRVSLRWLDAHGDPVFAVLPGDALEQVGFDEDEALFAEDSRTFRGFTLLREFFAFPQKFLGFRLAGLRAALSRVTAGEVDVLIEMDAVRPALAPRVGVEHFRLHAAPAVNLFEENCSQVRPDTKRHEYLVAPDSSPASHYEVHRIREVHAYYSGAQAKVPVWPLYGLPEGAGDSRAALYYTARRRPRRPTERERRFGQAQGYRGTETLVSLYEPGGLDDEDRVRRLQIKAICSNRHLPQYLPLADSGADFRLNDDVTLGLRCIAGPTPPRDSVPEQERDGPHRMGAGPVQWRILGYLALGFLGLGDREGPGHDGAGGLRELLTLFCDVSSQVTARQIQGIKGLSTRPVTRTIRRGGGFHAARGVEVTIRFDERAFEGSGIVLIGAVLDRFLAEYAPVNSFTQVALVSDQRGPVRLWPPRTGRGPLL